MPTVLFLSYHFPDEAFAELLARHLRTQRPNIETYFYGQDRRAGRWAEQLGPAIKKADYCVAVVGREVGATQREELELAAKFGSIQRLWVQLPGAAKPRELDFFDGCDAIAVKPDIPNDEAALDCAREVVRMTAQPWFEIDGVPRGYPFEYEKDIVGTFNAARQVRGGAEGSSAPRGEHEQRRWEAQRAHVPLDWPSVFEWDGATRINPVSPETIGAFGLRHVIVDPRADVWDDAITLPEARPRDRVLFPESIVQPLRVGIVVSGGVAPGINSVISGIFNRHQLYANPPEGERNHDENGKEIHRPYDVKVYGYLEGFKSLIRGVHYHRENFSVELRQADVDAHAHTGGSLVGTSRCDELLSDKPEERDRLLKTIVGNLAADRIDILYVIGGDGSMRAAHAIFTMAKRRKDRKLSVVAIPKTMDNDILWVWQAFGFLSAVEKAREVILHLQTEIRSNPRLCIVQLFGSDSGFVVAHAVLGTGQCDYALVPEVGFTMQTLCEQMGKVLAGRKTLTSNPYGMIVMSETAIPRDAESFVDDSAIGLNEDEKKAIKAFVGKSGLPQGTLKWRVRGQTPDALRTAGLKVVSRGLQTYINNEMARSDPYWKQFRVVTNEPRHILRSIPPSVSDVIFGQRLGALAVDNAMAGYSDFMVSQWLTEYVLVPLELVVLGRKRLPPDGIFWKSVLASTGQTAEALDPIDPEDTE